MSDNQILPKPSPPEEPADKGLDGAACSGVVVWAEDATGTARKCVYDDGDFIRMTRETRGTADSEWAIISEKIIHKLELHAASVFLPNADVMARPDKTPN